MSDGWDHGASPENTQGMYGLANTAEQQLFGTLRDWLNNKNNAKMNAADNDTRRYATDQDNAARWKIAQLVQQVPLGKFNRSGDLLAQMLGTPGYTRGVGATGPQAGGMTGYLQNLLNSNSNVDPLALARGGAQQPDFTSGMASGDAMFRPMSDQLFQQQLNQILGQSGQSLGGQMRGANQAVAGAGFDPGSTAANALRTQYGAQTAAGAQNALTGAFQNKYGQDFQRQQAVGGYNTNLANARIGQRQQQQQNNIAMANVGISQQQQANTRRGQGIGLLGSLLG